MKQRVKQNDEVVLQVYCLTADQGHVWMPAFDKLPPQVRRRLRNSPFNICAACLQAFVLPEVRAKHPSWPLEKQLLAGIEEMEATARKQSVAINK